MNMRIAAWMTGMGMGMGMGVLAGCASGPQGSVASRADRQGGDRQVLTLRVAKADGSGFEDAGPIVMTRQTQEFLSFMRVSSVTLTPDGRIASFTTAAPTGLPEGVEWSYESIVMDRSGNLISAVPAER